MDYHYTNLDIVIGSFQLVFDEEILLNLSQ